MNKTTLPGFTAESSFGPTLGIYLGKAYNRFPLEGSGGVMPQIRFQDPGALADYWRCRANGGGDLICRFFSGLRPFTLGGLLIAE